MQQEVPYSVIFSWFHTKELIAVFLEEKNVYKIGLSGEQEL